MECQQETNSSQDLPAMNRIANFGETRSLYTFPHLKRIIGKRPLTAVLQIFDPPTQRGLEASLIPPTQEHHC